MTLLDYWCEVDKMLGDVFGPTFKYHPSEETVERCYSHGIPTTVVAVQAMMDAVGREGPAVLERVADRVLHNASIPRNQDGSD